MKCRGLITEQTCRITVQVLEAAAGLMKAQSELEDLYRARLLVARVWGRSQGIDEGSALARLSLRQANVGKLQLPLEGD